MNKNEIISVVIAFLVSLVILLIGNNPNLIKFIGVTTNNAPKELYHVYLSGKSLGVIKSKSELESYIDNEQNQLKEKYNVDKVYAPNDLDVVKELTYNEKLISVENIYKKIEKIKGSSSFTIDGYKITINGIEKTTEEGEKYKTETITVYVIDKNIFTDAIDKVVSAYIDVESYKSYINGTQVEIKNNETGTTIEDIYISNNIIIKQQKIPAGEKIYQSVDELTQFLLFGNNQKQNEYVVKAGDTIEDIAEANKLSVEEFLIVNTDYKTSQDLLYPGAVVKLGLINPQFDLVEIDHVVSKKQIKKETVYENDNTQFIGYEQIKEDGQDGLALVTEKIQLLNGEMQDTVQLSSIELVPSINKIIVRGTKQRSQSALGSNTIVPVDIGSWVWPTNTPYTITSPFSWRWGKHHDGTDIAGPGYGSPIKAANNGIIIQSAYDAKTNGNYIIIKHSNGYYTYYGHMAKRYKQIGDIVMAGDIIGTMGMTGFATGVHLHFGLYNGYPGYGGVAMNAMTTIFR